LSGEPKASHVQQIRNLDRAGFAKVKHFDLPHKRAAAGYVAARAFLLRIGCGRPSLLQKRWRRHDDFSACNGGSTSARLRGHPRSRSARRPANYRSAGVSHRRWAVDQTRCITRSMQCSSA